MAAAIRFEIASPAKPDSFATYIEATASGGFAPYDQAHVTWDGDGGVTLRSEYFLDRRHGTYNPPDGIYGAAVDVTVPQREPASYAAVDLERLVSAACHIPSGIHDKIESVSERLSLV